MSQNQQLKIHRASDMYKWFRKQNPGTDITYTLFKEIISQFNKLAVEYILEGKAVNFGSNLGSIRIKKIERKFSKARTVNWGETNKLRKQGINQMVYFVDNYYYKWHWHRSLCKIKNKTVYIFQPTKGAGGNRQKLSRLLKSDDLIHTLYFE